MLIDTKQIVTKTELRENLTNILMRVENGKEMMISDRGRIKAKLIPVEGKIKTKDEVDKFMAEVKQLGEKLSRKNPNFDSVKALREMRRELSYG